MFERLRARGRPVVDNRASIECLALSRALMKVTADVLRGAPSAEAIVERHCQALVEATEHIPLVWAWFGDRDADHIRPQVAAGRGVGWARGLQIARNLLTCRGPAFRALAGERSEPFSISPLSIWAPWRDAAREEGIRSVLCLPLVRSQGEGEGEGTSQTQGGILVIYADDADYFEGLTEFFNAVAEMFGSILDQSAARDALSKSATTDALTGLGNRRRMDQLEEAMGVHDGTQPTYGLIAVDLDSFKQINDCHGHATGDAVLRGTARLLVNGVRHTDVVLRIGGEEFVVVLPSSTAAQASELAEALRLLFSASPHHIANDTWLPVTASFGVSEARPGETLRDVLRRADAALYTAKRSGRNRVCVAADGMRPATDPSGPSATTTESPSATPSVL